ncbi:MAG: prefoldin subunit alpha [Candidatus Odinarchaeota archaeon]
MEGSQKYQEQLIQIQYFREQYSMIEGQLELMNASLGNILNTKTTIQNIKQGVKEDDEILVPIGGLVNIKAIIKEPEKILLSIPQDVVIEKDLDGAIEFLDENIEKHNQQIEYLSNQLQKVEMTLRQISENVQRAYSQQ